jgi:hypothetical protein
MRVRIKSSASLNVPPGSVVDFVGFLLVFMFECVTVNSGAGAAMAEPQVDPTPATFAPFACHVRSFTWPRQFLRPLALNSQPLTLNFFGTIIAPEVYLPGTLGELLCAPRDDRCELSTCRRETSDTVDSLDEFHPLVRSRTRTTKDAAVSGQLRVAAITDASL